jgi:hypothetical protein
LLLFGALLDLEYFLLPKESFSMLVPFFWLFACFLNKTAKIGIAQLSINNSVKNLLELSMLNDKVRVFCDYFNDAANNFIIQISICISSQSSQFHYANSRYKIDCSTIEHRRYDELALVQKFLDVFFRVILLLVKISDQNVKGFAVHRIVLEFSEANS